MSSVRHVVYTRKLNYDTLVYMAKQKYSILRVRQPDIELLKIVAALSRQSMIQIFKKLVAEEYERLQQQQQENRSVEI